MTIGIPFKAIMVKVSPGLLETPDIYNYRIPIPVAFVFPNI